MKKTIEEMFEFYESQIPRDQKFKDRNEALASFCAGIMLTAKVLEGSKTHKHAMQIVRGLMFECETVAVEQIEAILKNAKASRDN